MSVSQFLSECRDSTYQPRETRPIAQWARENIVIDPGENRLMGGTPYEIENTPYNDILFDTIQSPYWRELIVRKPSQGGFTLGVFVAMAWLLKFQPGPMLYCARDLQAVREMGKRRLVPLLKQIDKATSDELDERDQTCVTKVVNGAPLRLVGAQTAGGMVSWPESYVFGDEYDTHPILPEGSTGDLMRARTKGDPEHKVVLFSKPHKEPVYEPDPVTKRPKLVSGAAAQGMRGTDEYYAGTQEKLHVPCPQCGHYQELIWGQMKLDEAAIVSAKGVLPVEYDPQKVIELTYYECTGCRGRILDRDKRKMLAKRRWVPTPMDQREGPYKRPVPFRRSATYSDLYVFIFDSVNWGKLMLKWHEAQGDDEKMDAFFNDHLGLPRPERKSAGKVEMSAVDKLISTNPDHLRLRIYDEGRRWQGPQKKLHFDPLFLGIGIDKQKDHLKLVIGAFDENGELHVLDYAAIYNEADLTFLIENFRVDTPTKGIYPLYAGLMDCGHIWASVMDYAFEVNQMGIIYYFAPARGVGDPRGHGVIWPYNDTSVPHRPVQVVNFNNQYWENEFFRHRIIEARLDKPSLRHPRIHLPQDADEDFKRELTNGHQTMKKLRNQNFEQLWWEKARPNEPNDYADCMEELLILWDLHKPQSAPEEPPPEGEMTTD